MSVYIEMPGQRFLRSLPRRDCPYSGPRVRVGKLIWGEFSSNHPSFSPPASPQFGWKRGKKHSRSVARGVQYVRHICMYQKAGTFCSQNLWSRAWQGYRLSSPWISIYLLPMGGFRKHDSFIDVLHLSKYFKLCEHRKKYIKKYYIGPAFHAFSSDTIPILVQKMVLPRSARRRTNRI